MDDTWEEIQGYGEPEKDLNGFYELDVADEDGVGVCRNLAYDYAKKLNTINPEYHAKPMAVRMNMNDEYNLADIDRNIVEEENVESDEGIVSKIIGNHMIVITDSLEEDAKLVIDPTNPMIGEYSFGSISMFGKKGEKDKKYSVKEVTQAIIFDGGVKGTLGAASSLADSYDLIKTSKNTLREKYNVDEINNALKEVRQMKKKNDFMGAVKESIADMDLNTFGKLDTIKVVIDENGVDIQTNTKQNEKENSMNYQKNEREDRERE